jgi:hypothetical protein
MQPEKMNVDGQAFLLRPSKGDMDREVRRIRDLVAASR